MGKRHRLQAWVGGIVLVVLAMGCPPETTPEPPAGHTELTYQLGMGFDVLDSRFYAGEAEDGSDVAGRMAFFGAWSNDGREIAFWGVNAATFERALFGVEVGRPGSWRKLTGDEGAAPDEPITWSPDNSHLLFHWGSIDLDAELIVPDDYYGYEVEFVSATARASKNWIIAVYYRDPELPNDLGGNLVALPIQANGGPDTSRLPVILTNFQPDLDLDWPAVAPDGSSAAFSVTPFLWPDPSYQPGAVYVLTGLQDIISAPRVPGTRLSSAAPTGLGDPRIKVVRLSDNLSQTPAFAGDGRHLFFSEEWNRVFRNDQFFETLTFSNFDIMIADIADPSLLRRLDMPGNQAVPVASFYGSRLLYTRDLGGAMHLFSAPLETITPLVGNRSDHTRVVLSEPLLATDTSGTVLSMPSGGVVGLAADAPADLIISAPTYPLPQAEFPAGVRDLPVVRKIGPFSATFDPAATVTLSYVDAQIAELDESEISVYRFNAATGRYDIEVPFEVHNTAANTIRFRIATAGRFALGAPAPK